MIFYFSNTNKDILMTEDYEKDFENGKIRRFCEKGLLSGKISAFRHITGSYGGPAHSKCNMNVTQKRSNFIPFVFHKFSDYDCHLLFKKLVDRKNDKVKSDNIPKTIDKNVPVTFGCITSIDIYRFLSSSLDLLVKTQLIIVIKH